MKLEDETKVNAVFVCIFVLVCLVICNECSVRNTNKQMINLENPKV